MSELTQSKEVQQMAIQVVVAGDHVKRSAAKYCNASQATIEKWAAGGPIASHPEIRVSIIEIAKTGLRRALDEYNII